MLKLLANEYESRRSDSSTPTSAEQPESIKVNVTRLTSAKQEIFCKKASETSLTSRYNLDSLKRRGSAILKCESPLRLNNSLNSTNPRNVEKKPHPALIKKSYIAQANGDIGSPITAATPKEIPEKIIYELESDHTDIIEPKCQKPLVPKKLHMGMSEKKEFECEEEEKNTINILANSKQTNSLIMRTVKKVLQQRVNKDIEINTRKIMGPNLSPI